MSKLNLVKYDLYSIDRTKFILYFTKAVSSVIDDFEASNKKRKETEKEEMLKENDFKQKLKLEEKKVMAKINEEEKNEYSPNTKKKITSIHMSSGETKNTTATNSFDFKETQMRFASITNEIKKSMYVKDKSSKEKKEKKSEIKQHNNKIVEVKEEENDITNTAYSGDETVEFEEDYFSNFYYLDNLIKYNKLNNVENKKEAKKELEKENVKKHEKIHVNEHVKEFVKDNIKHVFIYEKELMKFNNDYCNKELPKVDYISPYENELMKFSNYEQKEDVSSNNFGKNYFENTSSKILDKNTKNGKRFVPTNTRNLHLNVFERDNLNTKPLRLFISDFERIFKPNRSSIVIAFIFLDRFLNKAKIKLTEHNIRK